MKTKLLTICLLLFTSQVFAEDIIMKCRTNWEKKDTHVLTPKFLTYKYSKSLIGTHKIYSRYQGKWYDFCNNTDECKVGKLYGKSTRYHQKKSNEFPRMTENTYILDFVNKELIIFIKYDWGSAEDNRELGNMKDHYDCERVYD